MWTTTRDIEAFIGEFEECRLPKVRWTHEAHLVVGWWYLTHHPFDEALAVVRRRIRAHNESVGTANTNHSGYHETLTRFYLVRLADYVAGHGPTASPPDSVASMLQSPIADRHHALTFYSRERLFSTVARHQWLEPDLLPL